MNALRSGMMARSTAGHDRGRVYVILECDEQYVYLADGKIRPVGRAKKKKRKHVQVDTWIAPHIAERMEQNQPVQDADVIWAIKRYGGMG